MQSVGQQRTPIQARKVRGGMAGVLFGDDEVEVPQPGLLEGGLRFALRHESAHLGLPGTEQGQRVGNDRERRGLEDRDPDEPGRHRPPGVEVGLGQLELGEDDRRVLGEHLGVSSQHHPTTGAPQQWEPHLALEHVELLRDGRRAQVLGDRDSREGSAELQLAEQAQATDIEHAASFR